jgi:DNA-binding LytR/AlgR family response regulator
MIPDDKTQAVKQLTAAEAAKRVKRTVTEMVEGKGADGKPTKKAVTKEVPVSTSEVLAFRDHGTHVVVVTKDGQKFTDADE